MGLIAFVERDPNDKTPFKKNEWHVGKRDVETKTSDLTAGTRSPIRRSDTSARRRRSVRYVTDRDDAVVRRRQLERLAEYVAGREASEQATYRSAVERRQIASSTTNFAPARDYWHWQPNAEERSQEYMRARPDIMPIETAPGSPLSPGRIASPDTEAAIMRDLDNPSGRQYDYRLYVDGANDVPGSTPRMMITRSGGLLERRRSLSPLSPLSDGEDEEDWENLTGGIPAQDESQPSVGSSFASDSASSILSRRPRSTVTNTPAESRATSTGVRQTDSTANCPEHDPSARQLVNASTLAPVRYSTAPISYSRHRENSGVVHTRSRRRPEQLDDLMNMLESGVDVPEEMWASLGLSTNLGLRGGAGRLGQRSERLE